MSFTVVWMPPALQELAEIWITATDRSAITAASHRLDQFLASDPLNQGESRAGDERIAFEPPLCVLFQVYERDRTVEVVSVGLVGRRS